MISDMTILDRVNLLSKMHEIIRYLNNEDAYGRWIYYVPDEPTYEDFESIAEDDNDMQEIEDLFFELIKDYGKDGFCV